MSETLGATKTRFSVEPYDPLMIAVGLESFDLRGVKPFVQWHHSASHTDCFGIRLESGLLINLRVTIESSPSSLYGSKSGYYTVNVVSRDDADRLLEIWNMI